MVTFEMIQLSLAVICGELRYILMKWPCVKIVPSSVYYYLITNFQCVGHELTFLDCVPDIIVVSRANFNTCSGNV